MLRIRRCFQRSAHTKNCWRPRSSWRLKAKLKAAAKRRGTAAHRQEQCIMSAQQVWKLKIVNRRLSSGLLHPVKQKRVLPQRKPKGRPKTMEIYLSEPYKATCDGQQKVGDKMMIHSPYQPMSHLNLLSNRSFRPKPSISAAGIWIRCRDGPEPHRPARARSRRLNAAWANGK